ncbi:MAG: autotransporter-associated beta strand repeat-containing protein, partial [Candidatus Didemnitutus sp.]|nr:autotransporter-associated beta strand repeat-containing protein [Candidatus Didemnitutus sp.]
MKRVVAAMTMGALLISLGGIPQADAQTTFVWTGFHENNNFSAANNWKDNAVPTPLDGTVLLSFPSTQNRFVYLNSSIHVLGLVASGHRHIDSNESSLTLGAGGVTFSPQGQATHLVFEPNAFVVLGANQNWTASNGAIEVRSFLSGVGVLTKLGNGELILRHGNSNSGGINLNAGKLVLGANDGIQSTALGSGVLTIGAPAGGTTPPPTLVTRQRLYGGSYDESSVLIANNIVLNGALSTINQTKLTLSGSITLNTNTTITTRGHPLSLEGAISEATSGKKITMDGKGVVVLAGANTYTGGTTVNQGRLIFGTAAAVPATGDLTVAANGYLGFAFTTGYGTLINNGGTSQFDKTNTAGSFGFDSELDSLPQTFAEAIDLTGFNASARLGSASHAVISGNITPQGSDYRFGGGGGYLTVSSQLTGARNVVLDSPSHSPLTVRLTNTAITNNFTGNVTATHSGIIFGSNVKLPSGANQLTPLLGGYIGTAHSSHFESPTALNNYLPLFSATTTGVIGFDLAIGESTTRVVDLTGAAYTSLLNAYLGTSSKASSGAGIRFTGTISPNSNSVHRFAAFKGGVLEVAGTLPGNSLVIGHPDALSLFADRTRGQYSTVIVSGNNGSGLAGGTTFYGGHLVLGQSNGTIGTEATNALGSGTLTVAPVTFEVESGHEDSTPTPFLSAAAPNLIFNNAIVLNTDLDLGGNNNVT